MCLFLFCVAVGWGCLDHMDCCSCHSTFFILHSEGSPGRDRMVVRCTTTYDISAYHRCEFETRPWGGVLDETICNKVCQRLAAGRWFFPGPLVSSTSKTDRHHKAEIL